MEQREELLEERRKGAGQDSYGHNHVDQILEFSEADGEESTKRTLAAVEESTKAFSKAS